MKVRTFFAALVLGASFLPAAGAEYSKSIEVHNMTGYQVIKFYAVNSSTNVRDPGFRPYNMLPNFNIKPRQTIDANLDDGSGSCVFHIFTVFEVGRIYYQGLVNACAVRHCDVYAQDEAMSCK